MRRGLIVAAMLAALVAAAPAHATFPGPNGLIAFNMYDQPHDGVVSEVDIHRVDGDGTLHATILGGPADKLRPAWSPDRRTVAFAMEAGGNTDIYTVRFDGTDVRRVTTDPAPDVEPAWSPDGQSIVFATARPDHVLHTIDADGTDDAPILDQGGAQIAGRLPNWSPDGATIAFRGADGRIHAVAASGGAVTQLTGLQGEPCCDANPNWSPDGSRIAYNRSGIRVMNGDGTGSHPITNFGSDPTWSPDGTMIAFADFHCGVSTVQCVHGLYTVNADGSGLDQIVHAEVWTRPSFEVSAPDWGSFRPEEIGYPRPRSASPFKAPLVPAYNPCEEPNRTHGPPLASPSCAPPVQPSTTLTVGTPDANGQAPNSVGKVHAKVILDDPDTPADEADVRLAAQLTDVRCKVEFFACTGGALSDYTGELTGHLLNTRVTDREGAPSTMDLQVVLPFGVPCAATADAARGSDCSVDTTFNTLVPGIVTGGRRAIWQLGRFQLLGPDEEPFAATGVFVP